MNIRYPNITGKNSIEQLQQIRGFLFQLVEQLNMETQRGNAADTATSHQSAALTASAQGEALGTGAQGEGSTPMSTFNQVKDLIIKSADIVDAYYTQINKRLEGIYVAESDFGTYQKETSQEISATAARVDQNFSSIQSLSGQMEQVIKNNASIRTGLLFVVGEENLEPELGQTLPEGVEVYGVEVGQNVEVDGKEEFNKFARFTSYGMTLYDNNGELSAYITDSRLNIPNAVIKNSLTRGGYMETIYADGSSVERWVGV